MTFRVIQAPPQTLVSLWDDKDDIELNPVYQRRGNIWSPKQNQDLVDSVLNSFDIPKLYFADFTMFDNPLNATRKKYAVIDGKQRIMAIFGFFEGAFTLSSKFVMFDNPELRLAGLSYDDLVRNYPRIARKFDNYSLTIMSVVTDDEQKINELFVRLNSSKPLVGAEIRNAMVGEVPQLIRQITEHAFWRRVRFATLRGQDKNLSAKLLLLEHSGTFVDTKKKQLDDLVEKSNVAAATSVSTLASSVDGISDPELNENDSAVSSGDDTTADDVVDAAAQSETTDIGRSAARLLHHLSTLASLFIDNDPLLGQQAQIPVIYWLARELEPATLVHLRPFLIQFEGERQANRARSIDDPNRDMTLIDFELMTRTSNDQSSIAGRYRIVRQRFERFVETRAMGGETSSAAS